MHDFVKSYIETALFATTDDQGDPLDEKYGLKNLSQEAAIQMFEDCHKFQEENREDLQTSLNDRFSPEVLGGHYFWLTRNGHGTGFWDGDWPEEAGERLTKAAERFGSSDLYVGDDGKLYLI